MAWIYDTRLMRTLLPMAWKRDFDFDSDFDFDFDPVEKGSSL